MLRKCFINKSHYCIVLYCIVERNHIVDTYPLTKFDGGLTWLMMMQPTGWTIGWQHSQNEVNYKSEWMNAWKSYCAVIIRLRVCRLGCRLLHSISILYVTLLSRNPSSTYLTRHGHCWTVFTQAKAHAMLVCTNGAWTIWQRQHSQNEMNWQCPVVTVTCTAVVDVIWRISHGPL